MSGKYVLWREERCKSLTSVQCRLGCEIHEEGYGCREKQGCTSLLFGLYQHFLVISPDHVHSQPASLWGIAFIFTAYGLLITEAIGAYLGVHFLWIARKTANKAVKT